MLRQVRQLTLIALALAGCKKDEAPAPVAPPAAKNSGAMETDTYALAITSAGAWKAGAEGAATIRVTAKPPLHVNPEYPVSFKPEGSEGVSFGKDKLPLTASTKMPCASKAEDTCTAEFPLIATAEKAGAAKLAGTLSFSVCSDDKCLIEKVPVTLAVTAE
jgi:hypothetical protein